MFLIKYGGSLLLKHQFFSWLLEVRERLGFLKQREVPFNDGGVSFGPNKLNFHYFILSLGGINKKKQSFYLLLLN